MSILKKIMLSLAIVLLLSYIFSLVMEIRIEGVHEYTYYTELERVDGNWAGLIHWRVKSPHLAGLQIPELRELHMVPYPYETWRGSDKTSDLQLADSITVYALIKHDVSMTRARSGFFTWGTAKNSQAHLVITADSGSGHYVASQQFQLFSLPLPGAEIPLEKQAGLRRKALIPAGLHPSILWVLLAYFGIAGILLTESWRRQELTVTEISRERIQEGPVIKGYWPNIKGKAIKLPKHKYTSPALAELLSGEEFRHGVEVSTYIVTQEQIKEVRSGPLVWAWARKTRVELMLVVDTGTRRYSPAAAPEICQRKDAEFDDSAALYAKAVKRKRWLLPAGLSWR